ncbi:MAG: biotin transporter BioY [Actinobacteria bacterium]|nr:biotin transporter BioY [Actinomycetota bacterium]
MDELKTNSPGTSTTSDGAADRTVVLARGRSNPATDAALIAAFAALIVVLTLLPSINVSASSVPITLQTLGIVLAGATLGWKRGLLAVLLYIALGAIGLPVFAEQTGGLATFSKPSVGYLVSFPFAAALCGFLVERLPRNEVATSAPLIFASGAIASVVVVYPLGIVGLMNRLDMSFGKAFDINWLYVPGDIAKTVVAALVASAVHRAFPDLLPPRK